MKMRDASDRKAGNLNRQDSSRISLGIPQAATFSFLPFSLSPFLSLLFLYRYRMISSEAATRDSR